MFEFSNFPLLYLGSLAMVDGILNHCQGLPFYFISFFSEWERGKKTFFDPPKGQQI